MKKFTLIILVLLPLQLSAFDKFDNAVCEASTSDQNRIDCFREFGLSETCKNTSATNELNCYRKIASLKLSEQKQQEEAKQSAREASMPKPLSEKYARQMYPGALSPYTPKEYPKFVAKYGSRFLEIEDMRRKAVEMAIDSGKCDFVEIVELNDSKSTIENLQFWVDCKNQQRIYLDEKQLKSGAQVLTQEERSWTKESAIRACREAIKSQALIPSEVDIHQILGTSYYKAPVTSGVKVEMDFDAKNAYGAEIPYTASCYFTPGEAGTIDVLPRK